jgi:hypothetical protein
MCSSHQSLLSSVTVREYAPQVAAPVGQSMSSLIVLGIVAIWILVLVPMWLGRHDADSASRSMEGFSTAMRVLSRRPPVGADRVALAGNDLWGVTMDNDQHSFIGRRVPGSAPHRPAPSGRARLVARRRRIAVTFAVLMVGLAISAAISLTSWWFEFAVGLALAGYVVHLRNQAVRDAEVRRRHLARASRAYAASMAGPSASGREVVLDDATFETVTPGKVRGVLDDQGAAAAASAVGTENGSRWEPVPVPLPTYVSKPVVAARATAAPKADVESGPTIDLTRPGVWIDTQVDVRHLLLDETGSATISASAGGTATRVVVEARDDELDAIIERRRAVGD